VSKGTAQIIYANAKFESDVGETPTYTKSNGPRYTL